MGKKGEKAYGPNGEIKKRSSLSKADLGYLIEHTKYNKQEIREWYRKFLEECPGGVLKKVDLHNMYARIMPREDPSVIIDHLFRIFDRDGNGTIDFKEFVLATDITTSGAPEEKLRWTFKMYDKDGSGTIELAEMVEVLETVYVMEGVTSGNMAKTRAQQIFKELDKDGDGTLTCEEFIEGCMRDSEMVTMLKKNQAQAEEDVSDILEEQGGEKQKVAEAKHKSSTKRGGAQKKP